MKSRFRLKQRAAARDGEIEALNRIEDALSEPLTELLFAVRGAMRLPPKTEELVGVDFTQAEWQTYASTFRGVRAEFDSFAALGQAYCITNQMVINALLTPLKRLCSGGAFPPAALKANVRTKKHEEALARMSGARAASAAAPQSDEPLFPAEDNLECAICMEQYDEPRCTPCMHWFCAECITQVCLAHPVLASACPARFGLIDSECQGALLADAIKQCTM